MNAPWFITMNARTLGGGADLVFAFVDFVVDFAVCVFDLADFIFDLRRAVPRMVERDWHRVAYNFVIVVFLTLHVPRNQQRRRHDAPTRTIGNTSRFATEESDPEG